MGRFQSFPPKSVVLHAVMDPGGLLGSALTLISITMSAVSLSGCAGDGTGPSSGIGVEHPEPPAVAGPPAAPAEVDDRPMAISEDGRYRLRLDGMQWMESLPDRGGPSLMVGASLLNPDGDTLLAWEDPRSRFVSEDGQEIPQDVENVGDRFTWGVDCTERSFQHVLDVGTRSLPLRAIAYKVAILRVRSLEIFATGGIGRDKAIDMEASPFHLRIETGAQVCRVTVRGGTAGFLDNAWAQEAKEVVDSRGSRLECIGGSGGRESYVYDLAAPKTDGRAGVSISYPVELRLRVPKEYDLERVLFEFRDVALPARPGADPGLQELLPGNHRSAWSEERDGIALRLSLPESAVRGDMVEATLGTSFDPRGRSPDAPTPEGLVDGDNLRLILRNRESGATVELHRYLEAALQKAPGAAVTGDRPPAAVVRREWTIRFPLAAAWDALIPGAWEARASLEIPIKKESPDALASTVATAPIPLVIEEPPPERRNRRRLTAPTALRLRIGGVGCNETLAALGVT